MATFSGNMVGKWLFLQFLEKWNTSFITIKMQIDMFPGEDELCERLENIA